MSEQVARESIALDQLITEAVNPELTDIDALDIETRMRLINAEDAKIAAAVALEIPQIARAVGRAAHSLRIGGRLLYVGAGTSGRLGILDASECPPTFGVPPSWVQGIIAGGPEAVLRSIEGAEDDSDAGAAAIIEADVNSHDTVVGISASGRAPFVRGALQSAKSHGATTVSLTNNRPSPMEAIADIGIAVLVGPEVIAGSTRLKSGTAQKMVLNMLSTGAMIEIGKTYGNLMVDVQVTNAKLKARAARIVAQVVGTSLSRAEAVLDQAGGSAKVAIVILETGKSVDEARQILERSGGYLRRALSLGTGK